MLLCFSKFGNVHEIFISQKRNKNGSRFDFVKFIEAKNVKKIQYYLNGVWFDTFKLKSHLALFARNDHFNLRSGKPTELVGVGGMAANMLKRMRWGLVCHSEMWLELERMVGLPIRFLLQKCITI